MNNVTLMSMIQEIFVEEIGMIHNVTGFELACVFRPITMGIISHFSKNGENFLGITPENGPLIRMISHHCGRSLLIGSSLQHGNHVE